MEMLKVVEWVDIDAPRQEIFDLVLNLERRMQLSPLWGLSRIQEMSADYPAAGSSYRVEFLKGDESQYDTVVTDLLPGRKFAYELKMDRQTRVTWTVQDTANGARLVYEEEFLAKAADGEDFAQSVRQVIRQWLNNIRRYAELRQSRSRRFVKWLLDRYYLRLRLDQRKTIQTILFMQIVSLISFVMAAIALGLTSLI